MYVFIQALHHEQEYDTRSIFNQSTVGFNLEFVCFFSETDCYSKAKEPSHPTICQFLVGEEMNLYLSPNN